MSQIMQDLLESYHKKSHDQSRVIDKYAQFKPDSFTAPLVSSEINNIRKKSNTSPKMKTTETGYCGRFPKNELKHKPIFSDISHDDHLVATGEYIEGFLKKVTRSVKKTTKGVGKGVGKVGKGVGKGVGNVAEDVGKGIKNGAGHIMDGAGDLVCKMTLGDSVCDALNSIKPVTKGQVLSVFLNLYMVICSGMSFVNNRGLCSLCMFIYFSIQLINLIIRLSLIFFSFENKSNKMLTLEIINTLMLLILTYVFYFRSNSIYNFVFPYQGPTGNDTTDMRKDIIYIQLFSLLPGVRSIIRMFSIGNSIASRWVEDDDAEGFEDDDVEGFEDDTDFY